MEHVVLREVEERRPLRNIARRRHLGVCDGADQGTEERRPLGSVPRRQRCTSARNEHTGQLPRGQLRHADVQDDEVAHRGVERSVRKWKLGGRALDEYSLGMAPRGELDHGRGDVDPGRVRAACDRAAAASPGPVPTSSTRMPARTPAASINGSIACPVIGLKSSP